MLRRMHNSSQTSVTSSSVPQRKKNIIVFLQCAFLLGLEFIPQILAAAPATMGDLNSNPTTDSTFGSLWQNITFMWVVFQAIAAIVAGIFIYLGSFKIRKHEWGAVAGYWGSALGIALAPLVYIWVQHRAQLAGAS